MLESLKKRTGSWVARILIVLLVVSFAAWGVSDMFGGTGQQVVGIVGSTEISATDYQAEYERQLQAYSEQLGRSLTTTESIALQIPDLVFDDFVLVAALDEEADRMGLGMSDETVAVAIRGDPAFAGTSGQFNRTVYEQTLRNGGLTEAAYFDIRRGQELRSQIANAVAADVTVPDVYDEVMFALQNETRTVRYVTLGPDLVEAPGTPSEEELTAFFEQVADRWQAPETRGASLLALTPEGLAEPGLVTDEEARASYEERLSQFSEPETRHVFQVVFGGADRAAEVAAMLEAGQSFDELVEASEISPTDLGVVTRGQLDASVAETAFTLDQGATSGVIEGRFGPVIVHVSEVTAPIVTPFEEVRDQVVQDLAEERAIDEISNLYDQIEDAIAGGAAVADVAALFDLPLTEVPAVSREGTDLAGAPVDLPGGDELLTAIYESDVGLSNAPVQLDRWSFVWFDVTTATPAYQRPLDEVRDEAIAAWQAETLSGRLGDLADSVVARLGAGESFETVVIDLGLAVPIATAGDVVRGGATPGLSTAAVTAAFDGPVGHVASASADDGQSLLVLQVTESVVPDFDAAAVDPATDEELSEQLTADLLEAYLAEVEQRLGVSVNNAALQTAIGLTE